MKNTSPVNGYLIIFTLNAFALAQPLFDILASSPEFFVARQSKPLDIILLVVALMTLVPAAICITVALAKLASKKAASLVHGLSIVALVAIILLPPLKEIGQLPDAAVLSMSLVGGIAFLLAYLRFNGLRQFAGIIGISILLFPALFVFNSPVYDVVFPEDFERVQGVDTDASNSIFMLVFDELPVTALLNKDGEIDRNLFPNLAELASQSHWFSNVTTVATSTILAVPAIMTGNYPKVFATPSPKNYPDNVFTLLADAYEMNVFESVTQVCPAPLCKASNRRSSLPMGPRMLSLLLDLGVVYLHIVAPEGLASGLPAVNQGWNNFWQPEALKPKKMRKSRLYEDRVGQFQEFILSVDASEKPSLNFLHVILPHVPYEYLPSGKRYNGGWQIPGLDMQREVWEDNDWLITQGYQRFLLQLMAVDMLIGELVERLKAEGIYDSSIIVITSDHGVSFMPNTGRRDLPPMSKLERDIMPVPLLIKAPGQTESFVSDKNIETIDILPTVLDLLGIESTYQMDGVSALAANAGQRESKRIFYQYKAFKRHAAGPQVEVKNETVSWKLARFSPEAAGADGLFNIGYGKEFIGRPVQDIAVTGDAPFRVDIDQTLFSDIDPADDFVPALIAGSIHGSESTGSPKNIAISVNGIVRAVTQTYDSGKDSVLEFSAMVPESSFIRGANEIEAFMIATTEDEQIALLRLGSNRATATAAYTISSQGEASNEALVSTQREIPVQPGHIKGKLEYVNVSGGTVEFFGWALEVEGLSIPESILIFEEGKLIYSGKTTMRRHEISKKGRLSGFQFVLPASLFSELGKSKVRLFAVSEQGVASELAYFSDYEW